MPVTRIEASEVSIQDLLRDFNRVPRPAAAVPWAASRDEAMLVEHLVGVGACSARWFFWPSWAGSWQRW